MISFLREPNIVPNSDSFILLRKCQNMIYFDIYIYLLIFNITLIKSKANLKIFTGKYI